MLRSMLMISKPISSKEKNFSKKSKILLTISRPRKPLPM